MGLKESSSIYYVNKKVVFFTSFFNSPKILILPLLFPMKENEKLSLRQSVCISETLDKSLAKASAELELAKQDVIRLCLKIGLAHLEAVKYDISKCVLEKSLKK